MNTIRLDIPAAVPSLNKLLTMHWSARYRLRQEWAWLLRAAILDAQAPRHTFERARVTIERSGPRKLDHDNAVGAGKLLIDHLVKEGFLVDDDDAHVVMQYKQQIGEPHTTILLEAA